MRSFELTHCRCKSWERPRWNVVLGGYKTRCRWTAACWVVVQSPRCLTRWLPVIPSRGWDASSCFCPPPKAKRKKIKKEIKKQQVSSDEDVTAFENPAFYFPPLSVLFASFLNAFAGRQTHPDSPTGGLMWCSGDEVGNRTGGRWRQRPDTRVNESGVKGDSYSLVESIHISVSLDSIFPHACRLSCVKQCL